MFFQNNMAIACMDVQEQRQSLCKTLFGRMGLAVLLAGILLPAVATAAETFKLNYIDKDTAWATGAMQVTLTDLDNDGDLDWTVGVSGGKKPVCYWYEHQGPDNWVKHTISSGVSGVGNGAAAFDVNGDGYRDLVTGDFLFLNQKDKTFSAGDKIGTSIEWNNNHDHLAFDMNGDGKMDLLTTNGCRIWKPVGGNGEICWFEAPSDPTQKWTKHPISTGTAVPEGFEGLHAATSPKGAGDLDGDGDIDVVGPCAWYENTDGKGTQWTTHFDTDVFLGVDASYKKRQGYQTAVRSFVVDLNGDGKLDVIQAECDIYGNVRLAWLKNNGGGSFTRNIVREGLPEDYHSLAVADFDNDGDIDIFTACGPLSRIHNTYLFVNNAGAGKDPVFELHNLSDFLSEADAALLAEAYKVDHGHEPMFGDVDGDGDIDLVLKGWDGTSPELGKTRSPAPFLYLENTTAAGPNPF